MNPLFTGAIASAYVGVVVGAHRWNVWRLRSTAGGFPALKRVDWDALFAGLNPNQKGRAGLEAIAKGVGPVELTQEGGFTGGQVRWLRLVADAFVRPDPAFEALLSVSTAAELYLREHLRLTKRTHALNLELSVFTAKRELTRGIAQFGEVPALYFARALASSLIGFNRAAIDDLGRAVYFSRQSPFYLKAVLDTPYLEEARPALVFQCKQASESLRPD